MFKEKNIKIGIDATALASTLSGIGYYTKNMVLALANAGYKIYLFSPVSSLQIEPHKNIVIITYRAKWMRHMLLAYEIGLPYYIKKYKINLFWSPKHHLPFLLPRNLKTILTIHDLVWKKCPETMHKKNRRVEQIYVPYSVKRANHIIVDSLSTKYDLMKYLNCKQNKISVIYLAAIHRVVDEPEPVRPKISKIINNQNFILSIGTQEPRKNYARLIEAYAALEQKLKDQYKLIIVGGKGWGKCQLEELIDKLALRNNVFLLGYSSDKEVDLLLKSATILAYPSLYEGFGLPILEGFANSVPVLTSNNSSMAEIAKDAAYLVEPYSVDSIRDGLNTLLKSPTLLNSLKEKGKLEFAKYSWKKASSQFLKILEELSL